MSDFDKMRFAEAFGAAILGSVAYSKLSSLTPSGDEKIELLRKFQKALMEAANHQDFSTSVFERYAGRISSLSEHNRNVYMRISLQPCPDNFDEKMTAALIINHASRPDNEWNLILSLLSLDQKTMPEKISHFADQVATELEERGKSRKKKSWWRRIL